MKTYTRFAFICTLFLSLNTPTQAVDEKIIGSIKVSAGILQITLGILIPVMAYLSLKNDDNSCEIKSVESKILTGSGVVLCLTSIAQGGKNIWRGLQNFKKQPDWKKIGNGW